MHTLSPEFAKDAGQITSLLGSKRLVEVGVGLHCLVKVDTGSNFNLHVHLKHGVAQHGDFGSSRSPIER